MSRPLLPASHTLSQGCPRQSLRRRGAFGLAVGHDCCARLIVGHRGPQEADRGRCVTTIDRFGQTCQDPHIEEGFLAPETLDVDV